VANIFFSSPKEGEGVFSEREGDSIGVHIACGDRWVEGRGLDGCRGVQEIDK